MGRTPRHAASKSARSSGAAVMASAPSGSSRPLFLGAIPIKLDAVAIGITQINRFPHAMIARAFEFDSRAGEPAQRIRQRMARRI